jgi:alkyl hydroperoxide reductase subunit AhpF
MLESALKEQLKGIFAGLEANFAFDISVSSSHENRAELLELLGDVADCSDHITYSVNEGNGLKFTLLKNVCRKILFPDGWMTSPHCCLLSSIWMVKGRTFPMRLFVTV